MTDKQFIRLVDRRLRQGRKWREIAAELGIPLSTVYARMRNTGYRVAKRLEPVHVDTRRATPLRAYPARTEALV